MSTAKPKIRPQPARQLGLGKKLVFALIPVCVLLGIAELLVRATGAAHTCTDTSTLGTLFTCDPVLYFKLKPDLSPGGVPLNHAGFRSHEFRKKAPGVFRVLALGDSTTFGVLYTPALEYPAPYPELLERIAKAKLVPGRFEVLNAGVPGYNSYHGLMLLRTVLSDLEPDLITVRYGWNDYVGFAEVRGKPYHDSDSALVRRLNLMLVHSELYLYLRRSWQEAGRRFAKAEPSPKQQPPVPVDRFKEHLRRIVGIGRSSGAAVWLLNEPTALVVPPPGHAGQEVAKVLELAKQRPGAIPALSVMNAMKLGHAQYNQAVAEVAKESGAPLVDMVAHYLAHSDKAFFLATDTIHPTKAGHELEADVLFQELVQRKLVKP